uniref:EF-hand domain-containing protein n=1 Tax=Oxyrrhis marina TaxID=2969 RepID=A0A7S4LPR2_OXYMA
MRTKRWWRTAFQAGSLSLLFLGAMVWNAAKSHWAPEAPGLRGRRLEITIADQSQLVVAYEKYLGYPELVEIQATNLAECPGLLAAHSVSSSHLIEAMEKMKGDHSKFMECFTPLAAAASCPAAPASWNADAHNSLRTACTTQWATCYCTEAHARLCDGDCAPEVDVLAPGKYGLLPLYCMGVLYMFVGLAIVCDEFFVPSLELFVEEWEISLDVAGATFMAAGGSAPELFTSFIGTFKKSDVGFGTIVGSAVFNVLFVIGVCAIASKDVLTLTWWPLARDCSYYTLSLSVVALFFKGITPQEIHWWEALILFLMYFGYVFLMKHSESLRLWVDARLGTTVEPLDKKNSAEEAEEKLNVTFAKPSHFRAGILTLLTQNGAVTDTVGVHVVTQVVGDVRTSFDELDTDKSGYIEKKEVAGLLTKLGCQPAPKNIDEVMDELDCDADGKLSFDEFAKWYVVSETRILAEMGRAFQTFDENGNGCIEATELQNLFDKLNIHIEGSINSVISELDKSGNGTISKEDFETWYRESLFWKHKKEEMQKEQEAAEAIDPFDFPEGLRGRVWYIVTLPLVLCLWATLPDVRREDRQKVQYGVAGFLGAIVWIGIFSFCMVDWATVVSNSLGVPVAVAGLTVLAAGTSVPDLLSSVIVAKQGEGDMAVSSSIGSNIFDVLVGLPLPWLCFTIVEQEKVVVKAESLGASLLVLIFMLVVVICSIKLANWRMTRGMGYSMFLFYLLFVAQDLLRQLPNKDDAILPSF